MYNVKIFSFHHKPYENNLDRNIHIPFFLGDPKNNTQNFLMEVNYPNNIHYLNSKINEFTGIYCILNNFDKICEDLKINSNDVDFFGFEHYRRILDVDLNNLDTNCVYCWVNRNPLLFLHLIKHCHNRIRQFVVDLQETNNIQLFINDSNNFIGTERIICTREVFLQLTPYINAWSNIVKDMINDSNFTEYLQYKMIKILKFYRRLYPKDYGVYYLLYNTPKRLYGYLTEYIVGTIYWTIINRNGLRFISVKSKKLL